MQKHLSENIDLGFTGEALAAKKYEKHGYQILAKNFSNKKGKRLGEIDFVAVKDGHIRFVEVKSRVATSQVLALNEVNKPKQFKLLLAIKYFLLIKPKFLEYIQHIDVAIVLFNKFDKTSAWITIYSDVMEDDLG